MTNEGKELLNIMAEARDELAEQGEHYNIVNMNDNKRKEKNKNKAYVNKNEPYNVSYPKSLAYLKTNLGYDIFGIIYMLTIALDYPSNSIIINGEIPTIDELLEFLDIGRTKFYEVMKILENNNVIKRVKKPAGLVIYLNPYVHSSGRQIDIKTRDMFRDSIFNNDE